MQTSFIKDSLEFRVNGNTHNNQAKPELAALENGGFVVTWQSYGPDGTGPTSYTQSYRINAQRFDANGLKLGGELDVGFAEASTYTQASPQVAGLSNGNFMVVWEKISPPGGTGKHLEDIYGQLYSPDGIKIGGELQINIGGYNVYGSYQNRPAISALEGGGFVAAWEGYYGGIFVQKFDNSGAVVGDAIIATATDLNQNDVAITGLGAGGYVATWNSYAQDGDGSGIYGQVFDASGAAIGTEFRVNTETANNQHQSSVTALEDGGFLVAFRDDATFKIRGQRFDSDGNKVAQDFTVNASSGNALLPEVTSLTDGGLMVVWNTINSDGNGFGIEAQRISADGNLIGSVFDVNTTTAGDQKNPTVAGLKNGSFVISWQSADQDGDGLGVYAQQFAAQWYGTSGKDTITDTHNTNWLGGLDGNDLIKGKGGNDEIYGGNGADTIYGDKGRDTLFGENGADKLFGGGLADTLYGGVRNDILEGGTGNDILMGDSGNDKLSGQAGNDELDGGIGKDRLIGGDGRDILRGGVGKDVLQGGNKNDTLYGGAGADNLTGGANADRFIFTLASDSSISSADRILDFTTGLDKIVLSDVASGLAFVSGGFSGSRAEVRVSTSGSDTIVRVDTDADGNADMKILVLGTTGLDAGDFIL